MPEKQKQSVYTKDVVLVMAASFFFMFSTMIVTPLINGFSLEPYRRQSFRPFFKI